MKKKQYYNSKMKYELAKLKEKNSRNKSFIWKLNDEQVNFVRNLGYSVEPYLYAIKTKRFYNVRNLKHPILKEIHYKNKKGCWEYVRTLTNSEKDVLKESNIKFYVAKYKILFKK